MLDAAVNRASGIGSRYNLGSGIKRRFGGQTAGSDRHLSAGYHRTLRLPVGFNLHGTAAVKPGRNGRARNFLLSAGRNRALFRAAAPANFLQSAVADLAVYPLAVIRNILYAPILHDGIFRFSAAIDRLGTAFYDTVTVYTIYFLGSGGNRRRF